MPTIISNYSAFDIFYFSACSTKKFEKNNIKSLLGMQRKDKLFAQSNGIKALLNFGSRFDNDMVRGRKQCTKEEWTRLEFG